MSGDSQGMAIAVASSHLSFRSHTMDIETTIRHSFTTTPSPTTRLRGDGYFGRYQQRDSDGKDMTDSTLSLEALAALFGPTTTEHLDDDNVSGDTSPPIRSQGFTAFKSSNPTPNRKVQSFPKINRLPTNQSSASHHKRKPPVVRSRSVRFADTQGLPLEIVKPLTSADPFETEGEIVPSLSSDLGAITLSPRPLKQQPLTPAPPEKPQMKRVFKFSQPGTQPDFYQRLQKGRVCLESIRAEKRALHGIVRAVNLSYEKQVIVRWTHDKWLSYHDSSCLYCQGSSDGHTDRFSFTIPVNGDDIEFAICYRSQGNEYWDNNQTHNYLVALEQQQ